MSISKYNSHPPSLFSKIARAVFVGFLFISTSGLKAENKPVKSKSTFPVIRVQKSDWGNASIRDIKKVLNSTAKEWVKYFPERKWSPILVSYSKGGPIVLFKRTVRGETHVQLNVRGLYWSQMAYQFAHELGHIAFNYDRDSDPNEWLEEAACEAVSIFVLQQMAKAWKTDPPYPNWKSYSKALKNYADDRLKKFKLKKGQTFKSWFKENENQLRKSAVQRNLNGIVAKEILPLIQKNPESWVVFSNFNRDRPKPTQTLKEKFQMLKKHSPKKHKKFIDNLAKLFSITL